MNFSRHLEAPVPEPSVIRSLLKRSPSFPPPRRVLELKYAYIPPQDAIREELPKLQLIPDLVPPAPWTERQRRVIQAVCSHRAAFKRVIAAVSGNQLIEGIDWIAAVASLKDIAFPCFFDFIERKNRINLEALESPSGIAVNVAMEDSLGSVQFLQMRCKRWALCRLLELVDVKEANQWHCSRKAHLIRAIDGLSNFAETE